MNSSTAQKILSELEPLLGRLTSRKAVELVLSRIGKDEASLSEEDLPEVQTVLMPMLRQLLGRNTAERAFARIVAARAGDSTDE